MKVTRAYVPNDNDAWNSFFNGFNNPLLVGYTENGNRCFNIANIFDVKLIRTAGYVYAYYKGNQFYSANGWSAGISNHTIVAIDDNFAYVLIYAASDGAYSYRSLLFIYDRFNDMVLTGHRGFTTSGTYNTINTLTLTDENTSEQYAYSPVLNYSVAFTNIDYTAQYMFKNSLVTNIINPHLIACTNTTFDMQPRVLTFHSRNYYVAGNNSLILIDGD